MCPLAVASPPSSNFKGPFICHFSRKCLFEKVGHVGRVFGEASVSIFER